MTPFLHDDEMLEMCRPLVQPAAMCRYLTRLGVPHVRRPDGSPLVSREAVAGRLSGALHVGAKSGTPDKAALLARFAKRRAKT